MRVAEKRAADTAAHKARDLKYKARKADVKTTPRVTFDAEPEPRGLRTTRVQPLEVEGRPPSPLGGEDTD